jgi:TPR repeat protein
MVWLAYCYEEGVGIAPDLREAFKWYCRAADADSAVGMVRAGNYYRHGHYQDEWRMGVRPVQAGCGGNGGTSFSFFTYLMEAGAVVPKTLRSSTEMRAFKLYRRATEAGDTDGMVRLGDCYERGIGVAGDLRARKRTAAEWFRRAAESGNADGMWFLGYCYEEGVGVEKDPRTSFEWQRRAAEAGSPDGMKLLASCYRHGYGVDKDLEAALHWSSRAAETGPCGGGLLFHVKKMPR